MTALSLTQGALSQVTRYFRGDLYLFVPNVCNAACDFCYVQPAISQRSSVSEASITRLGSILEILSAANFKTVRITGGEPLIFENLTDVVEDIFRKGMSFTLLTNGMLLHQYSEFLLKFPPRKVTVSLHSATNPQAVFGVSYSLDKLQAALHSLAKNYVAIEITTVFNAARVTELEEIVTFASDSGVRRIRLIAENTPHWTLESWTQYDAELMKLATLSAKQGVMVRGNDTGQDACELMHRGRLSLSLPQFDLYSCCVQVGDSTKKLDWSRQPGELMSTLQSAVTRSSHLRSLQCASFIGTCPISKRLAGELGRD